MVVICHRKADIMCQKHSSTSQSGISIEYITDLYGHKTSRSRNISSLIRHLQSDAVSEQYLWHQRTWYVSYLRTIIAIQT